MWALWNAKPSPCLVGHLETICPPPHTHTHTYPRGPGTSCVRLSKNKSFPVYYLAQWNTLNGEKGAQTTCRLVVSTSDQLQLYESNWPSSLLKIYTSHPPTYSPPTQTPPPTYFGIGLQQLDKYHLADRDNLPTVTACRKTTRRLMRLVDQFACRCNYLFACN